MKIKLEFKVNEYITLKLENEKTIIYINGKRFMQCIRLLLSFPKEHSPKFDKIKSIDEASEVYDHYLWENRIIEENGGIIEKKIAHFITPEQEFMAHCSNLQAWAENNYNTNILHSNLSFPLLTELNKAGDPIAKRVFGEEIAKRIENGYLPTIKFLFQENYLDFLNSEQKKLVVSFLKRNVRDLNEEEQKSSVVILWNYIGWIYNVLYKYDKSISAYKNAIKIDPMNAVSWNSLGVSYNEKGKHDKALEAFKKANKIHPKQKYYLNNLGWTYSNLGEFDKAIEMCEKAIDIHSKYANPWNHIGFSLYKKGEEDKAIELIKKSLKLKPTYSRAQYYLAKIYFELERYDEAFDACDQCIEIIRSTIDIYQKSSFDIKKCIELREKIHKAIQKKT